MIGLEMIHKTALAWCVHAFTASGLVLAGFIAVFIVQGTTVSFCYAFLLMILATIVDAVDGTLARWAKVREVLPNFDGRRLDDIIDFHTYATLPLLLLWRAEILPGDLACWLLVPLIAAAYGFSQTSAKTDDGYFLGFPSYWNVVAFYLFVLRPPAWASIAVIVGLSLLTFVPARYLYPSQGGVLNRIAVVLGILWLPLAVWVLYAQLNVADGVNAVAWWVARVSLFFPIYYLLASWAVTWNNRRD